MEDAICVEEWREDQQCDSSAISLKSVLREFNDSMLKGPGSPIILNENHQSIITSENNTEKETVVV